MDSRPDEAYAPSSPLVLSLLSLLAPTHNPLPPEGLSPDKAQRLSLASSFAQGAAEACVIWSHKPATSPSSFTRSALHPDVPADLEVPLAYCVLSLYQYLHCGNIKEMTECTEKALDAAIKLSLHKKSEHASNISMEARSRAWWITVGNAAIHAPKHAWLTLRVQYLCVCHAAMAGCKVRMKHLLSKSRADRLTQPPTRPIDHSEIQTPFPTSLYVPGVSDHALIPQKVHCDSSPSQTWDRYIRAEETLVAATLLLVALVKGFHSEEAVPSFQQSIKVLDDIIKYQISQLADARTTGLPSDGSPESRLASCLHEVTHIRLMRSDPSSALGSDCSRN